MLPPVCLNKSVIEVFMLTLICENDCNVDLAKLFLILSDLIVSGVRKSSSSQLDSCSSFNLIFVSVPRLPVSFRLFMKLVA